MISIISIIPDYVKCISEYKRNNVKETEEKEIEGLKKALLDEYKELKEERFLSGRWFGELVDCISSLVQYLLFLVMGVAWMHSHSWIWVFVFFLSPLTSYKHVQRYRKTGCIRSPNHHPEKKEECAHVCEFYKKN